MRKIIAIPRRGRAYDDPGTAICESAKTDSARRSVSDQEVRGQRINRVLWADSSLVLELNDRRFLNCNIENGRIGCVLGSRPAILSSDPESSIVLEFEKSAFEWRRAEVVARYVGKVLDRLWFGDSGLLIYVRDMPILSCHILEVLPESTLMLFWAESD
jgi:hypothetical protein